MNGHPELHPKVGQKTFGVQFRVRSFLCNLRASPSSLVYHHLQLDVLNFQPASTQQVNLVLLCEICYLRLCLEMDLQSARKRCVGLANFYGRILVVEKGVTTPKGKMRSELVLEVYPYRQTWH